jgi:cytochrome c
MKGTSFMSRFSRPAAAALAFLLAACGSQPEPPVEQIVVRQPGSTAAMPPSASAAPAADAVAAGRAAFAACSACHAVAPGAASGVGPNLHGVAGRKAGSLAGFAYSAPMSASGLVWTETELDAFLANPKAKVPGTSMTAGAVTDTQRRREIVAYLSSLTS